LRVCETDELLGMDLESILNKFEKKYLKGFFKFFKKFKIIKKSKLIFKNKKI